MEIDRKKYSRRAGIYRLYSLIDDRCYIGSSKNLYSRLTTHFKKLNENKHTNRKLQAFYNMNSNCLAYEVLCLCKVHELNEKEDFYRNQFCSFERGFDLMSKSCRKDGNIISKKKRETLSKLKDENHKRKAEALKKLN